MTIGARLREERERLKISQTPFAEAGGATKQTQHAYESNKTTPKGRYLAKVAALGVDVGYVITGIRAENVAHTPTELGYLRHCRILATRNLHEQGLKGLQFLRESNGIPWTDMPAVYQAMQTGEEPEPTNEGDKE
ncbi:helix-turn-helix domain-containing protein [Methylomonas rapida]|uniref:Helix-turn-helix transcriptional regulator n=1 Tax=Methylomonas rapida TaxID=2963939 RepID=A0ABY7GHB8_9GAMM|nr:helix-turn-helix transcriptional regulator [Methylomonas rapida]WAR43619.1 helix-turn-helix transcriptional regulator [Methylomonas rapida]